MNGDIADGFRYALGDGFDCSKGRDGDSQYCLLSLVTVRMNATKRLLTYFEFLLRDDTESPARKSMCRDAVELRSPSDSHCIFDNV